MDGQKLRKKSYPFGDIQLGEIENNLETARLQCSIKEKELAEALQANQELLDQAKHLQEIESTLDDVNNNISKLEILVRACELELENKNI